MENKTIRSRNLVYQLHESEFVDFTMTDSELIFKVAINCGVEEKLGVNSDFAEKFYIFDIICHNYKMYENNYNNNLDLFLKDIQYKVKLIKMQN